MTTTEAAATSTLGKQFAEALARKDFDTVSALLHPEIDFRGLTPHRHWEASTPDDAIRGILREWFEDSDHIDELVHVETDAVADRERVAYRFHVTNPKGRHVVEQQAYLAERDGQIGWMRVLCSGFRPLD